MYFGEIPSALITVRPSLIKSSNTTSFLASRLAVLASEGPTALRSVPDRDHRDLWNARPVIGDALRTRGDTALTISLFDRHGQGTPAIGRLLSLLHLSHYLDLTSADIMTGIQSLEYYDSVSRRFPRYDVALANAVLGRLGLGLRVRYRERKALVGVRLEPEHIDFLEAYSRLIVALHYRVAASQSGHLYAHRLGQVAAHLLHWGDLKPVRQLARPYSEATANLLQFIMRLRSRDHSFALADERYVMESRTRPTRVLLLAATPVERDSILRSAREAGTHGRIERSYLEHNTVFHLGHLGGAELLMAQTEAGTESPGGATLATSDLIRELWPDYIISCGIAYGLKRGKQSIGDILVSTQVRLMDPKKVAEMAKIGRGDRPSASPALVDRARSSTVDWPGASMHFGLLLSSNTLVNSPNLVEQLQKDEPDAIGGEMEAAGVYSASARHKVDWITIKAICDWGYKKSDRHQTIAAQNAADYVFHMLSIGALSR